ncbi:MAG TPA: hypothetical protein VIE89_11550 [Candidatus Binatia bacterium]
MACIRNRSRILGSWLLLVSGVAWLFPVNRVQAAFAIRFSPTIGELYTDNIFYTTKNKEGDFVTTITPTVSILYAPEGQLVPTLNLNISPSAVLFAHNSDLNNFGDNWGLTGSYNYQYSPDLSFFVSEVVGRQGNYRLGPLTQGAFGLPSAPTSPPPVGGTLPGQQNQNLSNFTKGGPGSSQFWNNFSLRGTYLARPDLSFTGGYTNNYVNYLDQSGHDLWQTVGLRGAYNWGQGINVHAGVHVDIFNNNFNNGNNNNNNNVVVSFDLGSDYFSNFQINLSPTLTLAASTGISLNIGRNGQPVNNNTNITLIKIWERASASAGVQHGITSSYGVGGISNTTTVNGRFNYQVTEKLSTTAGVDFSFYDTDDGNFQTFQAGAAAQYQFTSWLHSNLTYIYRWTDSSNRVAQSSNGILQTGIVRANAVYLTLTASFDLWPNFGLTRSLAPVAPLVTSPFPQSTSPTYP